MGFALLQSFPHNICKLLLAQHYGIALHARGRVRLVDRLGNVRFIHAWGGGVRQHQVQRTHKVYTYTGAYQWGMGKGCDHHTPYADRPGTPSSLHNVCSHCTKSATVASDWPVQMRAAWAGRSMTMLHKALFSQQLYSPFPHTLCYSTCMQPVRIKAKPATWPPYLGILVEHSLVRRRIPPQSLGVSLNDKRQHPGAHRPVRGRGEHAPKNPSKPVHGPEFGIGQRQASVQTAQAHVRPRRNVAPVLERR